MIRWGLADAPQCACGNFIENCIQYYVNTNPASTAVYPLLCGVCDFLYIRAVGDSRCDVNGSFTISFFSGQFGVGALGASASAQGSEGTFNGHCVGVKATRLFQLNTASFASLSGSYVTEWFIKRYFFNGAIFYTFSQSIPSTTSDLNAFVYFYKTAADTTLKTIAGFQIRAGTINQPTSDIMWRINYSDSAFTTNYFIVVIRDFSDAYYLNSNFVLTQGSVTSYPCRIYSTGNFPN